MKPRCNKCGHKGIIHIGWTPHAKPRPIFKCGQCDETWTKGETGGEYAVFVKGDE